MNKFTAYTLLILLAFLFLWGGGYELKDFSTNLAASLIAVLVIAEIYDRYTKNAQRRAYRLAASYSLSDLNTVLQDLFVCLRGAIGNPTEWKQREDYINYDKVRAQLDGAKTIGFYVGRFWVLYIQQIDKALEKPLVANTLPPSEIDLLIRLKECINSLQDIFPKHIVDTKTESKNVKITNTDKLNAGVTMAGITSGPPFELETQTMVEAGNNEPLGRAIFWEQNAKQTKTVFQYSGDLSELGVTIVAMFEILYKFRDSLEKSVDYPETYRKAVLSEVADQT